MPAVFNSNDVKDINLNTKNCYSPSSISIKLPINFKDNNFMASKSEHKALFESDLEVSMVCTTDSESESTADVHHLMTRQNGQKTCL